MASLASSFVPAIPGSSLKPNGRCLLSTARSNLSLSCGDPKLRKSLIVQARSDGGKSGATSTFIGGFVLGGLVVGALGFFYAPQISEALAESNRKKILKKLPKFISDEDKVLERNRKELEEKIAKLNDAIDVAIHRHRDRPPIAGDDAYL